MMIYSYIFCNSTESGRCSRISLTCDTHLINKLLSHIFIMFFAGVIGTSKLYYDIWGKENFFIIDHYYPYFDVYVNIIGID